MKASCQMNGLMQKCHQYSRKFLVNLDSGTCNLCDQDCDPGGLLCDQDCDPGGLAKDSVSLPLSV